MLGAADSALALNATTTSGANVIIIRAAAMQRAQTWSGYKELRRGSCLLLTCAACEESDCGAAG